MAEDFIEKMDRVCGHDEVRRELLWLRAQEREDARSIAALERADPGLGARMRAFMAETRPDLIEDPRQRRQAFASLFQRRFDAA